MGFVGATLLLHLISLNLKAEIICEEEYNCYEDTSRDIVWVTKIGAVLYNPKCKGICENALLNNQDIFHSCDDTITMFHDIESFSEIAAGLGFTCTTGIPLFIITCFHNL